MKKGWLIISAAIILLVIIYYTNQISFSQARDARPVEGFLAPDFTLMDEQGEEVTLSQLRGKPVFVNFWASWCPPCREEMPFIQEAYEQYGDRVVFLGVNATAGDVKEDAIAFMKTNNFEIPILFDYDGKAIDLYRTRSIPTSFFIDKNGVIQVRYNGAMNYDQIVSYLKKVMEE